MHLPFANRICLIGPPGSGKTTTAHVVADRLGFTVIDTGNILRNPTTIPGVVDIIGDYDPHSGNLLESTKLNAVVTLAIEHAEETTNGWILVGTPRQVDQLTFLEHHHKPDLYITLTAPEDILRDRIVGRSQDVTGEKRGDDTPEKFNLRYLMFNHATRPVIERLQTYYAVISRLVSQTGADTVESVCNRVLHIITTHPRRHVPGGEK